MKTVTLIIGNSDNKLRQSEWAEFVSEIESLIRGMELTVHFFGGSVTWAQWQNCCWVFDCPLSSEGALRERISKIREKYFQKSAAWTDGATEFI